MRKNIMRLAVAAIALLILGFLSRVPYDADHSEDALLRLSWRTRGEPAESCRNRTPEELAALPAHMRVPQECVTRPASYRLEVKVDDRPVVMQVLKGSGARSDRPVYVLWQETLTPGTHRVSIEFYSTHDEATDRMRLHETINVRPGEIVLVTQGAEREGLQLRRAPASGK